MLLTPPASSPLAYDEERVFHESTNNTPSTPTRATREAHVRFLASRAGEKLDEDDCSETPSKKRRRLSANHSVSSPSSSRVANGVVTPVDEHRHVSHNEKAPLQEFTTLEALHPSVSQDRNRGLPTTRRALLLGRPGRRGGGLPNLSAYPRQCERLSITGSTSFCSFWILMRVSPIRIIVSMNPLLESFVSRNQTDQYRIHAPASFENGDDPFTAETFCIPFSAMYSNGTKLSGFLRRYMASGVQMHAHLLRSIPQVPKRGRATWWRFPHKKARWKFSTLDLANCLIQVCSSRFLMLVLDCLLSSQFHSDRLSDPMTTPCLTSSGVLMTDAW